MTKLSRNRVLSLVACLGLGLAGFSAHGGQVAPTTHGGSSAAAAKASPTAQTAAKGGAASWGYEGRGGPEHWGSLSRDYHVCAAGVSQSPIDLSHFDGASATPIAFDYRLTPVEVVNNGHTIQVNYAPGSGIEVGGARFELLQFHFHAPSEHSIDGRQAPMEAHLVHKSADGRLAVIGVMMEVGAENLALGEFWGLMPRAAGQQQKNPKVLINARDLLPPDARYYRYMGSLTTPPCSEGVHWYVMATPVPAAAAQIEQFRSVIGANARPVQPVNNRLVLAPR